MLNYVKKIYIGFFNKGCSLKVKKKGQIMNEMRLSNSFIKEVIARFVPTQFADQDNKVAAGQKKKHMFFLVMHFLNLMRALI